VEALKMEKYSDEVAILVAQAGPLNGQRWALRKTTLLGREPTCDIVIADRQVSRHHARLTINSEGVFLEDLGSKNGTHHNGVAIQGSKSLQDGDTIQIALAQKFLFLSSDATVPLDEELGIAAVQIDVGLAGEVEGIRRLYLDKRSRRVWVRTGEAQEAMIEIVPPLSVSQFRLLEQLYDTPGRVVPRQELVISIWGQEQAVDVSEQALDALVRRLRERIASVDASHPFIVTVRGHGLRLDNPPV
jgi:hypothetical protein